jgi:hypothetical protein
LHPALSHCSAVFCTSLGAYLIRDAIAKAGPFSASEDNSQSIEILGPSGLCNQPHRKRSGTEKSLHHRLFAKSLMTIYDAKRAWESLRETRVGKVSISRVYQTQIEWRE